MKRRYGFYSENQLNTTKRYFFYTEYDSCVGDNVIVITEASKNQHRRSFSDTELISQDVRKHIKTCQ